MTQQTQKTVETQPTFTSGPSFGHFGRPFSHEFEDGAPGLQTGLPFDSFPVDPARIVIMQRTVQAKPGFGVPVSALGGFGVGMGLFSPFDEPSEESYREQHSKRSAYVETVSDEEVSVIWPDITVVHTPYLGNLLLYLTSGSPRRTFLSEDGSESHS